MYKKDKKLSRRAFILRGTLGTMGVLALGTYLFRNPMRRAAAGLINEAESPYMGDIDSPSIWFEINSDNTIILYSPKVEMGQGTFTGLAQIAADELGVSMKQIKVMHAPSISGNLDQFATGGSTSISSLWIPLRELAATMRVMILKVASEKLGTISDLTVNDGIITVGDKTMTYAEVVKGVDDWKIPDTPELKPLSSYKYVGQPIARVDLEDKVYGAPIFGMDATMPDMLYGAVVRPDTVGATFVSADISKAKQMPGVVQIVQEKDFVGVVANSRMEAEHAKNAIEVQWNIPKLWQTAAIEAMIEVGKGTPFVIQKNGNASEILEVEEGLITAEYSSPIGAHAQMEPNGALAFVEADKATLMMSTQVVSITRAEVAKSLGFDEEQVNIIPTFLGGGFGRRLHTPNSIQAALLSKAVGKPVKCFFNRQEEFQNDTFRPPTHHLLKAKLNAEGLIEAIEHNVSSGDVAFGSPMLPRIAEPLLGADLGAWRGGMIQYEAIPNYRTVSWRVKLPFATSWWRSLGLLANTFAIESFMDELALKSGKDPIAFRLDQIQNDTKGKRLKAVIKAAAERANYRDQVVEGKAMGFACSTDVNTPCAQIAEVSVTNNQIKVHKVICAMDPGLAVNPDQVKAQCEGSIIMGLSAALHEEMFVKDGQLQPIIYGPYQMARMKDAPKDIDVVLLNSTGIPGAVGEPPIGPIGAAIANAVFRLTGQRLRSMPLKLS